jgi:hypothetical protein
MWPMKKQIFTPLELDWLNKNRPDPYQEDLTPDFPWLERHEWVYLFVYGEDQRFGRKYDLIKEESFFRATAFTQNDQFAMWKKKLGEETLAIPIEGADRVWDGNGVTSRKLYKMKTTEQKPGVLGRIKGEWHQVRPWVIETLDKAYLNGVEFKRERVKLLVPYRIQQGGVGVDHNEFIKVVKCWMYVGIKDYWIKQLDGGMDFMPVGAYAPRTNVIDGTRIGTYYAYTRLEDETNF